MKCCCCGSGRITVFNLTRTAEVFREEGRCKDCGATFDRMFRYDDVMKKWILVGGV